MNSVTSNDVARLAGVSQSAVSRFFTPGASVSTKTAEKVQDAAKRLGYRPNVLARSLITGNSRIIGLVVAYLENQFYPEALERLSHELKKKGYHILVFMASNDLKETEGIVENFIDYQVEGIIAASVALSQNLAELCRRHGIPVLLFNRHQGSEGPPSVTSENISGSHAVAEFLVRGGHKRIAHISGWLGSSTGRDRENGFRAGLASFGMKPFACIDGMYRRDVAADVARALFAHSGPRPDAIFVGNDHMAFAVMDVLRCELGIRIPEDISVVGYDDVPLAAWGAYDLTTMRQPLNRMVETVVHDLLHRIADPEADPVQIRIEGELKIRGSARTAKERTA